MQSIDFETKLHFVLKTRQAPVGHTQIVDRILICNKIFCSHFHYEILVQPALFHYLLLSCRDTGMSGCCVQNVTGQQSCSICAAGTHQTLSGSTTCDACPENTYEVRPSNVYLTCKESVQLMMSPYNCVFNQVNSNLKKNDSVTFQLCVQPSVGQSKDCTKCGSGYFTQVPYLSNPFPTISAQNSAFLQLYSMKTSCNCKLQKCVLSF